jgi:hypothetical protein
MGKFLAALFSLVLGAALGAVGIALAAWVATALYRAAVALDWAVWLVERSPLPLYAPAVQVANDAIRRDSLIAAGLAAAVLCLAAFSLLRFVRKALRSADESHDGKGTIELKTQPLRVGRPVEGNIWLTQESAPNQLYRVELSCKRDHGSGSSEGSETPYWEELEVAPVRTPVGWSLPFRFVVPAIAPPSGNRYMTGPGYRWHLAFRRSKGWISFPSVFALHLAPAPPEELRALEKKAAPAQRQAIEEIVRSVGKEPVLHERVQPQDLSAFGDATPGGARAPDTVAFDRSTGISEGAWRGGAGSPESGRGAPVIFGDLTSQAIMGGDPLRLTRVASPGNVGAPAPPRQPPRLRDVTPGDARAPDTAAYDLSTDRSEGASLPGKIVKWLFLVVFGGVLAVSAVALATAVLLSHIL